MIEDLLAGTGIVEESDRPDPGGAAAPGAMVAPVAFRHGQDYAQCRALQSRVALQEDCCNRIVGHANRRSARAMAEVGG
ncbi:MAG: hypothetical protein ACKODB_12670 [Betaproteobacteria bacterium]